MRERLPMPRVLRREEKREEMTRRLYIEQPKSPTEPSRLIVRTETGLTCEIALVNTDQVNAVQCFIAEEESQCQRERNDLISIYRQRDELEAYQWELVQGIVQRLMPGQSTHLDIIRNGHKVPYSFARWIRTPEANSNMEPSCEMPMTAREQDAQA